MRGYKCIGLSNPKHSVNWRVIKFSDESYAIKNSFGKEPYEYELISERIENEANARLISCAPEMLEALIEVYKIISNFDKGRIIFKPLLIMIKKLIEKATKNTKS